MMIKSADDDSALPAIVSAARALVLRYRRAPWLAEAIRSDAARRVALRALREVRDALAVRAVYHRRLVATT